MSSIFFSVIIPLYNKQDNVAKTVKSVLGQSFQNFELLIIDDGSTDNGLSILKEIIDPRLKIICKINGGVSSARNVGIKLALGEYLAFLDADDIWFSDHLAEAYKYLSINKKVTWYSAAYLSLHPNQSLPIRRLASKCKQYSFFCNGYKYVSSSSIVIKKSDSINGQLKFPEDMKNWEDICAFSNYALHNEEISINHRPTSVYYIYNNSASSLGKESILEALQNIILKLSEIENRRAQSSNYLLRWLYLEQYKRMSDNYDYIKLIAHLNKTKKYVGVITFVNWIIFAYGNYFLKIIEDFSGNISRKNYESYIKNYKNIAPNLSLIKKFMLIAKNSNYLGVFFGFCGLLSLIIYGIRGAVDKLTEIVGVKFYYFFKR